MFKNIAIIADTNFVPDDRSEQSQKPFVAVETSEKLVLGPTFCKDHKKLVDY